MQPKLDMGSFAQAGISLILRTDRESSVKAVPDMEMHHLLIPDYYSGLSLSFNSPAALILTPVSNLLLHG